MILKEDPERQKGGKLRVNSDSWHQIQNFIRYIGKFEESKINNRK